MFDNFLNTKGYVDILSFEDAKALTIERAWCLFKIAKIQFDNLPHGDSEVSSYLKQVVDIEEELFLANRLLVVIVVKKFKTLNNELKKDFLSFVSDGLVSAIHKYDITSDTPFYSFAKKCIINKANNCFRDHIRNGWITPIITSDMKSVMNGQNEGGDDEDIGELMENTNLSEQEIRRNIQYINQYKRHSFITVSLDTPSGSSNRCLYDTIEDETKNPIEDNLSLHEIKEALKGFPRRERTLIEARFFKGRSLEEVGKKFKVSRSRVHQLEGIVLQKLKAVVNGIPQLNEAK